MKNYFERDEFYKEGTIVSDNVTRKIDKHIGELNPVRGKLGVPVHISKNSGYRPVAYELSKGRSGKSQHCYVGEGAVDVTCEAGKFQRLYELLQDSGYKRICLYPDKMFIHCDYKGDERVMFVDTGNGWKRLN